MFRPGFSSNTIFPDKNISLHQPLSVFDFVFGDGVSWLGKVLYGGAIDTQGLKDKFD